MERGRHWRVTRGSARRERDKLGLSGGERERATVFKGERPVVFEGERELGFSTAFLTFFVRKIFFTYFPKLSIRFSFILFFLLFFSTPNKVKKLTFSSFFFFHLIFLGPNTPLGFTSSWLGNVRDSLEDDAN